MHLKGAGNGTTTGLGGRLSVTLPALPIVDALEGFRAVQDACRQVWEARRATRERRAAELAHKRDHVPARPAAALVPRAVEAADALGRLVQLVARSHADLDVRPPGRTVDTLTAAPAAPPFRLAA